jgi:CRP-like cAMP-binding protein
MTQTAELRRISLFAEIAEVHLRALVAHASEMRLNVGEVLFANGDAAEHFYVLLAGEIQVAKIRRARDRAGHDRRRWACG